MHFSVVNLHVLKKKLDYLSTEWLLYYQNKVKFLSSFCFGFHLEHDSSGNILEKLHQSFLLGTPPSNFYLAHLKDNLLKQFFTTITDHCAAEISQDGSLDILWYFMSE